MGTMLETTLPGLGLISQPYESDRTFDPDGDNTDWERFAAYLDHLNRNSHPGTKYKLIYAARHGQGYHNVKESEVGTEAWEVCVVFVLYRPGYTALALSW